MFCHRFVKTGFVVDLLMRVIVSLTVSFYVGFCVSNSDDKVKFDTVIISNPVHRYAANLES